MLSRVAGWCKWAVALCLVALVGAGYTATSTQQDTTTINFDDYASTCQNQQLSECYRSKGVIIRGAKAINPSGGNPAIQQSCPAGNRGCVPELVSIEFTTPVTWVAMRVGHGEPINIQRTGSQSCPTGGPSGRRITLTALSGTRRVDGRSVEMDFDTCAYFPAHFGPLRKLGERKRVEVKSPAGATITKVELLWEELLWEESNPIIVDDLQFQRAVARLGFSPAPMDLGTTRVSDTSAPNRITVRNNGTIPVTIQDVRFDDSNSEEFTVVDDHECEGQTLAVGSTCAVDVSFTARGEGQRTATLIATTTNGTAATMRLTANGVAQPVSTSPVPSSPPPDDPTPSPWLLLALALLALLILGLLILSVVLLSLRLGRKPRARGSAIHHVPARVWVQPGPAAETIRVKGPDGAVSVVLDPTAGYVTWTARRQP